MNTASRIITALLTASLIIPAICGNAPATVVFGDSITVGYGAHSRAQMWTELLEADVGAIGNRAVAGSTVAQQLSVIRGYAGPAQTALWMSCTNDLFAQTSVVSYTATLRTGVLALQARDMRVYLGTCLGLKGQPALAALHTSYSEAARSVASETGAILVDVDTAYAPDTMEAAFLPYHPSDVGHAAIAGAFRAAWRWQALLPLVRHATNAYPAP